MSKEIDARGLSCPEPVIMTKKALEEHDRITVIVDSTTAEENVKRFALNLKCEVQVEHRESGAWLHITRIPESSGCTAPGPATASGPLVVTVSSDRMGRGDDELGRILMRSFIHTLSEADRTPDTVIFLNTGVRLAVQGSEVLDDLETLCKAGAGILVCGTCLGYFELKDRLAVGTISNMYDITGAMFQAGNLIQV